MRKSVFSVLTALVILLNLVPWAHVFAAPNITSLNPSNSQSVYVGTDAVYRITIQNTCSQADIFNVTFSPINSNWSVSLYGSDNSTPLSDHNGDGIVDTGSVASGGSVDIYVSVKPGYSVCNNSQYVLNITFTSTNGNCGGSANTTLTTTAIHRGNLVISKEVNLNEAKVGDTVTWTIHIKNTGQDTIGNVHITDILGSGVSNPSNFSYSPVNPTGSFPNWIYSEIPPGEDFTISFQTKISGCSNAHNEIDAWWGVDENNKCQTQHALQSVKIIPTTPNIQYTPPNIVVPYCGSTNVNIPITNSGDGVAKNFKLKIDKIPSGYQISNIDANWSYDQNTGEFIYNGGSPAGTINPNQTVNLSFTISMPYSSCNLPSQTLKYYSEYDDPCDNPFINPSQLGSISVSGSGAYFSISKSGPDPVDVGETNNTYTISVTYHKGGCPNSSVVVDIVDTLPTPFIPQSASDGGAVNGQQVEWDNITLQDNITRTFTITFNVTNDPCYAGNEYTNTVTITGPNGETLTDCCGCPIQNVSSSFSTFINNPANAIVDSRKFVSPSSIEVDCSTDTGAYTNPSGNPDNHNDRRYTVEFDFNTGSNAPSTWDGIIFRDNLNNNQYTSAQIANTVVEVDCGTGYQSVSGWSVTSYVPFEINLSGLNACAPNTGAKLRISFTARATQTNDQNNTSVEYGYIDWSTLEIPGFPRGCSTDPKYYEGIRVRDFRANLLLSANLPQIVEKCETYNLTINFTRENANVDHADLILTLNGFSYVSGSTTYSDNGSWCSGTKGEPTVNGNILTWSWQQINEIYSDGSITIQIKKDCSNNASVSFSSNYLDNCGKTHSATASSSSILIKEAVLYTKITPQLNFAYSHTVDWKVYALNGGDGTAREVILKTTLGSGLSFNSSGAYVTIGNITYMYGDPAITWPANGSTGTLSWDLRYLTISPSTKIEVYFKTDVNSCDENGLTVEAFSSWCNCQESNHDRGQIRLPTSYALITITTANVYLCSGGNVEVSIKNPGSTHIYNVILYTYLPKYLKYKLNSAQYSYNGGLYQSAGNPTINPVSGGDYDGGYELIFSSSNIGEFSDLSPGDEIKVKFEIEPDSTYSSPSCSFFKGSFKKIKSFAEFAKPCDVDNSTETSNIYEREFTTYTPNLSVTKRVIQINGSNYTYTNTTFPQELGTNVTFEIRITNNGNTATIKTNLIDILQPGGASHNLNYISGEYQYNSTSGTWINVPWDSTAGGKLIWNNIESDLGHGIEPGKTLYIRITAQIDPTCTGYLSHNYTEVWTGCDDLTDFDGTNHLGNPIGSSANDQTLTSNCPIYQAEYARLRSFEDARNVTYAKTIPDNILVCTEQDFEIRFTNASLTNGGVSIYGPIEIYDLIPVGSIYVSNSTTITLPDNSTVNIEPTISTETINSVVYPRLTWIIPTSNLPKLQPDETIKVSFKVTFSDCSAVNDPGYNRQRMKGYDCLSGSGDSYLYPSSWPGTSSNAWVKEINILKPNIEIIKTVDKEYASPGDYLLYMIRVRNAGDGVARNFKIIDTIPNGLILDTSSITDGPLPGWGNSYSWMTHSYDINTNTITWESNSSPDYEFPAGAETTVSFRVLVSSSASGDIINTAEFTDSCCYAGNKKLTYSTTTKITSTPIRVIKSIVEVNGSPVKEPVRTQPGDIIRYRIKVENRGSLPIYNVDVYDTLPSGVVYQNGSSRYAMTNGSLPTSWTSTSDPNTSPYLTPPPPPPGFSGYQWHIRQTLLGTDDDGGSIGANLDTLYLEFLAKVTTSAPASPIGSYLLNTADTSGTEDQAGNTPISRDVIDTNLAKAWNLNYKPELQIYKSVYSINGVTTNTTRVQPGDIVRFKIQVKNTSGYGLAIAVVTTDTLPSGFSYIYGSTNATWTGGSSTQDPTVSGNQLTFHFNNQAQIAPGDSLIIYYNVRVTTNANLGRNCNSSSAQGKDLDNGTISATAPDGSGSSSACVDVYKPVLRVTKIPQSYIATIGNPITFIIKVENLDSYAGAQNINISDTLPTGWVYVNNSSYRVRNNGVLPTSWGTPISNPTQVGQTLTWNFNETLSGTDDQGGSSGINYDTLWLKFDAYPTNSSLGCANKNIVTVNYRDRNNGIMAPVTDEANVCVCSPKLEMEKSSDLTEARVNEELTFILKISNKNPVDAFQVNVQDYLPSGWVYVSGSGRYQRTNGSSPNPSNWITINPSISGYTLIFNTNITVEGTDDNGGSTGTKLDTLYIEFKAKPTQNANYGFNINRAVAEGVDSGGNPIGSNEDNAIVTVRKPEISITKSVDKDTANIGDTLTYTMTVTNSGNLDLINATITDTLPDGVTWISGGSYSPPNIVTFSGLTIPQGGSIIRQITVQINKNLENGAILTNIALINGSDDFGNSYSNGPATAQTLVNAPKLLITKSSTPNPVKAGENITYTITVTNSGDAPATNVVITDVVPNHTTFVSADNNGVYDNGVVTWNIGTINANSQVTVHFVVKVDSPIDDNTIIENKAKLDSGAQGPIDSEKVINVVSSVPQLAICKSDSQDPVKPGNQFTYTIRYANNSTMNITNVVIVDTLPNGLTYVSATPNPSNVNGQTITWNIGNLPAGSSGNITLTVQVNSNVQDGTTLTNIVEATSNETPRAQAIEETHIGTLPNLTISKSDSIDPVFAGSQFTYTIKYQNTGGQNATNVKIEDTIPSGLTFVSAEPNPTSINGQTLTWEIGTLPANTSGEIIITVEVPINTPNGTVFTNTAIITSSETYPVSDTENTTVQSAPILTINKDAETTNTPTQPGDIVNYTIMYGNTGNLTSTNTFIVDAIPQNTRFVVGSVTAPPGVTVQYSNDNGATWTYTPVASSDGTDPNVTHIRWNIGNLPPNVNQQVTFQVKINSPLPNGSIISNTATIDSDQTGPVQSSKSFVVGSAPNIHITKTSDKENVQAGDNITYVIEYWNDGNMDATGVVITETYDPNVEFVSAIREPDTGTNNVWTIGNLTANGVHQTITITVKVKSPLPNGTIIHNVVTIDSDQTNPQQTAKDVVVGSAPVLTISKSDTRDPVDAGDNIIYTITVGNTGNAPATNVVVTDTVPQNTTFVSARFISRTGSINAPQVGETGIVTFSLSGVLNQNEEFVVELIVKVNTPLDNNTIITNTAKVTCSEDPTGKESSTATTVKSAPILSIDKVDIQDPVTAGSNITYRITVTNSGNMNAHNIVVTDSTPANTTFVSAQFVQGNGTISSPSQGGTGEITFNISSVNKDETVIVEIVVKTNAPLPNGTQITNTASVKSDEIQTPVQDTEITIIGSSPVLTISKTSSPNPISAGDNITYTITVTNSGNMDATQFVISDSVPANTTFVSARFVSGATGTITAPPVGGTGTVTWNPNPAILTVGTTVVVELIVKTVSPLPSGTVITNTAYADSAETQQISATNTTTVSGLPNLVITKTAYPSEQAPNGLVFYSITVGNTGNAPATNVTVTEAYPSEVIYYYASPQPTSGNNLWVIPRIEAGTTYTITVAVKVKENVPLTNPPVKVKNTASVNCAEVPNSVTAVALFEVKCANFNDPAHVTQRKEVNPKGSVVPGTWLTYTNYFGNTGNAPAINVKIVDPVDSNIDESTLQISDGNLPSLGITVTHSYDPIRREITWTIPTLPPNVSGWVSFKAMVRPTLLGSTIITNTTRISADNYPKEVYTNTVNTYVSAPCPVSPTPTPPTPPTPPSAIDITFNIPETVCASSFTKFVLTFTGGTSPYEYEVDFGDHTLKISGTEQGSFTNLTHVYDKPGNYIINVVVRDKTGKTATLTKSVMVEDCTPLPSVYHHNFIIGYPDSTVRPDRFVSRAEVAAMILRALGIDATKLSDDILPFKDIPVTHWAYNFTRRIYQEGLMQGDEKGRFNPDKFATRAEIATILVRLGGVERDYSDPLFFDIKKDDWFTPYINAAVKAGLITGYPDKMFKPNKSVTRAEFAAMLERILGREDIPQLKQFDGKENIIAWNDISSSHWAYYIMLEAWQPHVVTNVARANRNITVKSKSIPVYITTKDSKVIMPKVGNTVRAILPVDGIINGVDPQERDVFVKIINKEKP